ncbi:MAG: VOC family protein [Bacillota bacterium]|jgi:lactoylglutathione lyase
MKFSWCTLMVNDMEKSLAFYQGFLGLNINRRFSPDSDTDICFLSGGSDQAEIELIYNKNAAQKLTAIKAEEKGVGINLGIDIEGSLDEMIEKLDKHNIKVLRGPIQPSPQIRFLFVNDPNGYEVQLAEHL